MTQSPKVQWHDWSDEAFAKAQAEEKPIVLNLGATWCQGCREMDETTYRDDDVALLLNRDYVAVRVDTDRRPDINERYNMGGWPTTAFLTPAGDLLGGTTYVPRDQMRQLLVQLKVGYERERHRLREEISRRDEKIAQVLERPETGVPALSIEIFRKTVRGIAATFDPVHAGFGNAPKFPLVPSLRVVLQALYETQGPDFHQVLCRTLDAMGDRGMFDATAGGFFHYVTNDVWTAPRFEKIGEDNAGLVALYLDASLVTGQEKYALRAHQTMEWVRSALWDEARGVFGSSQAADEAYYTVPPAERAGRAAPAVDRTVFTPTAAALASAGLRATQVLGDEAWARMALRALDFLLRECASEEGVAHYHDGTPQVRTLLRDPVALASALLDAYDHTGERRYLDRARGLAEALPPKFWWESEKGFGDRVVDAVDRGELTRLRKQLHENAQAAGVFARLWRLEGVEDHRAWAERLLQSFPDFLDGYGHSTAEYALAADWIVRPPQEIGPAQLREYVPRRIVKR